MTTCLSQSVDLRERRSVEGYGVDHTIEDRLCDGVADNGGGGGVCHVCHDPYRRTPTGWLVAGKGRWTRDPFYLVEIQSLRRSWRHPPQARPCPPWSWRRCPCGWRTRSSSHPPPRVPIFPCRRPLTRGSLLSRRWRTTTWDSRYQTGRHRQKGQSPRHPWKDAKKSPRYIVDNVAMRYSDAIRTSGDLSALVVG